MSVPGSPDDSLARSAGVRHERLIPRGAVLVHPDMVHVLLCGDDQTRARVTAILAVASETTTIPPLVHVPGVSCLCGRVTSA